MSQLVDRPRLFGMPSPYVSPNHHRYVRQRNVNRSFYMLLAMVTALALAPILVALAASAMLM